MYHWMRKTRTGDAVQVQARSKEELSFHNSGGPLKVPGFGCAVNTLIAENSGEVLFRHGLSDFTQERLVAKEIAMLGLMDSITDKPRWHEKVFDEFIVEKWRVEATQIPLISQLAWDWCLRELREKAEFFAEYGFVKTLETGSVCAKADDLIDTGLRDDLLAGVANLLDVEENSKDWHPGSDQKVLNLVHPSLFPLTYGRTQVLHEGNVGLLDCVESCGKGEVAPQQSLISYTDMYGRTKPIQEDEGRVSTRFQWLPAEVKFTGTGSNVQFASYINNLHPVRHRGLYSSIAKVISKVIPMWNHVLVKGDDGCVPPRIMTLEAKTEPPCPPRWISDCVDDDKAQDPLLMAKIDEYLALPDPPNCNDDEDDDEEDRMYKDGRWKDDEDMEKYDAVDWKFHRLRQVIHPEPGDAFTYEQWKAGKSPRNLELDENGYYPNEPYLSHDFYQVNMENDFKEQGLQVIVKLASVELTPEKPEYEGGNWHLEGMMNEHIVATAIYYYDVDNISDSRLSFRMEASLSDDLSHEQDDHYPLEVVFGAPKLRDEPAIQDLGTLQSKAGRLLAFPNTLQHKVEPFKLLDPTRAGHRRFLVLWLVDPNYRIASTANVPPQQHDWWAEETVEKVLAERDLAVELQDMIREGTAEYPVSLETAKELRLELMQERTRLMPAVKSKFQSYNLCEH